MRKKKLLAVLCGLSMIATSMTVSLAADVDTNLEVSITEEVKEKENAEEKSDKEADVEVDREAETKKEIDVETKEGIKKVSENNAKNTSERAINVNITYSPSTVTNGDVTVTLNFDKDVKLYNDGWTKVGGGLIYSTEWKKTFTENTTEIVSGEGRLIWEKFETAVEVNNIDREAPSVKNISYDPNQDTMTKGDVIVSVEFDEAVIVNAAGWYYENENNSIWKKAFAANGEEEVSEVQDIAGNKMEDSIMVSVNNIDKDAPYAMFKTFSTVNPTNKDVTVKVTFNEDVAIAQEGWKSVDGQKDVWEKTFAENAEETVVVKDMVGNEGEVKISIDNIDKQMPDILYTVFSTYEPTKYKVVTTITYSEAVDVSTKGYRPLDDTHTVWQKEYAENTEEVVVAADAAGNVVEKPVSITNIDTKAPSVMNVFYTPDKDKLTNSDVTVAVVFDEAVTIDAEGWYTDGYSNIWKKVFTINGEETIVATDAAGNTIEKNITVNHIDKTAPIINGVKDDEKYDKEVSATIEDENLSEVILNDQPYDYKGGEIKFTENGVYTLIARDAAGNETKVVFELAIANDSDNDEDDQNNNGQNSNDDKDNNRKDDENKAVKTGDNFNLVIPSIGLLASIVVVVALLRKKFAK